jgi:5,10-methylene-tetrahydrofolate dehydrogenase/methenyl tetrahydrofolate cyclohydrolase
MNTHTLPAFNLSGRIALVTGASKGMGRSIAAILAQAGARVVISSRNQADCDRVAAADDVAGFALLLASPAGSFINGQSSGWMAALVRGKR